MMLTFLYLYRGGNSILARNLPKSSRDLRQSACHYNLTILRRSKILLHSNTDLQQTLSFNERDDELVAAWRLFICLMFWMNNLQNVEVRNANAHDRGRVDPFGLLELIN